MQRHGRVHVYIPLLQCIHFICSYQIDRLISNIIVADSIATNNDSHRDHQKIVAKLRSLKSVVLISQVEWCIFTITPLNVAVNERLNYQLNIIDCMFPIQFDNR
jgi:hypothetical protein